MDIIKPVSIPFKIHVVGKNWVAKEIKFPYKTSNGDEIHIFNIDRINNILRKLYVITGIPSAMLHVRGLAKPYAKWVENYDSRAFSEVAGVLSTPKSSLPTVVKPIDKAADTVGDDDVDDDDIEINRFRKLGYGNDISGAKTVGFVVSNPSVETAQWPQTFMRNNRLYIDTPLNAIDSPYVTFIRDVPSDNQYMQMKDLRHEVEDIFITDLTSIGELVVMPLNIFVQPNSTEAKRMVNDPTSIERVYYGFINKYYPLMSETAFRNFITGSLLDYKNQHAQDEMESVLLGEMEILLQFATKKYSALTSKELLKLFNISITNTVFNIQGNGNKILLRNLFDKTHIATLSNVNYMYMELTIDTYELGLIDGKKISVQLEKFKNNVRVPRLTNITRTKTGIMFVFMFKTKHTKTVPQYLYLEPNGDMRIALTWPGGSNMSLDTIYAETYENTKTLIDAINKNTAFYGRVPIRELPPTRNSEEADYVEVSSISMILTWENDLSLQEFKKMRELFREYIELDFAEYVGAVIFEVRWKYMMTIPCILRFTYQITSIRIEVVSVHPRDFSIMLPFLYLYLEESFDIVKKIRRKGNVEDDSADVETKRIKRLHNEDSILYDNLKPGIVYSKKCQGIRQPNIYTAAEYAALSAFDRKRVTTYWNFRRNQPAYYSCQKDADGKDLMFSFITGIHVDDLCVPCCKSKSAVTDKTETCMKKHKYINTYTPPSAKSAYVIVANKLLSSDRIGYLPDNLIPILGDNMYCRGMTKHVNAMPNSPINIVFAIADALDMTVDTYIMGVIKNIRTQFYNKDDTESKLSLRNPQIGGSAKLPPYPPARPLDGNGESLALHPYPPAIPLDEIGGRGVWGERQAPTFGGISKEYGNNLIGALTDIFINNNDFNNFQIGNWVEFFVFQTLEVYNHNVVLFKVYSEELILLDNKSPKIMIVEYVFPEAVYAATSDRLVYYPVYKINPKLFYSNGEIIQKVFTGDDDEQFEQLDSMLSNDTGLSIKDFVDLPEYNVTKLFVNRNNKCYGLLIAKNSDVDNAVFMPVNYGNVHPGIPLTYAAYNPKESPPSLKCIAELLNSIDVRPKSCCIHTPSAKVQYLNIIGMNLYVWHNVSEVMALWPELPQKADIVDYIDVNIAITENKSVDKQYFDIMRMAKYNTKIYELIKIELLNVIDTQNITIQNLRKMTVAELADLVPHIIEVEAKLDINIIIPCAVVKSAEHCSGHKLIVPPNYIEYIKLVKLEIDDPVNNFIDTSKRNLVLDLLNFEKVSGENIAITHNGTNIYNLK